MSESLHAYKNVVDGTTYVFAAPRPDLEARPNFEKADLADVPEATKSAALRQKAAADSIAAAGRTRESLQAANGQDNTDATYGGSVLGDHDASLGVFQVAASNAAPVGGVLSRGIVKSPMTRDELVEQALADADALTHNGVLAANLDGSQVRTGLPGAAQADVVNAPPVGDTKATGRRLGKQHSARKAAPEPHVKATDAEKSADKPATA